MKLCLIDGYAMMFRAFYAVRFAPIFQGKPIGAVFGCASTILHTLENFSPDYLIVAFDAPQATFRHEMDAQYKAQRTKAPDEFIDQIPLVMEMIEAFKIPIYIQPGFEADDLIGTLAKKAESLDIQSYILSGDLDFLQLISDHINLARFNGKNPQIYDRGMTHEKLGIYPEQIIDYKALCGDSSDNYKGLEGIGPKTAIELLKNYKTLKGIYQNLDSLKPHLREKFENGKEQIYHCQKLATIHTNVPVEFSFSPQNHFQFSAESFETFFDRVGFPSLKKRTQKLALSSQDVSKTSEGLSEDQMRLF
jgi:DNA polymerase I